MPIKKAQSDYIGAVHSPCAIFRRFKKNKKFFSTKVLRGALQKALMKIKCMY